MDGHGRRRFRIGPCLGRGGFGEVYRATLRSPGGLDADVAIKLLRSDLQVGGETVRRLRDEGRMLGRIRHPAVVQALDLVRLDGRVALVTEYVDGEDLVSCLQEPDFLPLRPLLQVVAQIAAALDAAWSTPGASGAALRIVHRDVKPSNLRVGRHGQAKLLDFGVARFQAEDREAATASDVVVGSAPYMAPERFVERAPRPAGDVFGLGCVLFEGMAGERFHAEASLGALTSLALDRAAWETHLAARLAVISDAPAEVASLVRGCLAHDPESRPSAAELVRRAEALSEALAGPTLRRWCADRRWAEPALQGAPLEGRVLPEEPLDGPTPAAPADEIPTMVEAQPTAPRPPLSRPAPDRPRVIRKPQGTLDPAAFEGDLGQALAGAGDPMATPAFPSLPLGVSVAELMTELETTDEAEKAGRPRRRRPERAPAPNYAPMVAGGCGVLSLVGFGLLLVGVLAFAWLAG